MIDARTTLSVAPGCSFQDVRGSSFDALDRATASYEVAFGSTPKLRNTYDGPGDAGLLTGSVNATGQATNIAYDADGQVIGDTFSDSTPARSYSYDPDGRTVAVSSPAWGTQNYTYDAAGELTGKAEPTGGAVLDPGIEQYAYYPDGARAALSLQIPAAGINLPNAFQYSYRTDGLLQSQRVNAGVGGTYSWTYTTAGRELTQRDPSTGATMTANLRYFSGSWSTYPMTFGPRTTSYNAYGQVASITYPTGFTSQNYSYDAQGNALAYRTTAPSITASTGQPAYPAAWTNRIFAYTTRGAIAGEGTTQPGLADAYLADHYLSTQMPNPCESGATGCRLYGLPSLTTWTSGTTAPMACSLNCSVTDADKVANGLVDDSLKFDARSDQVLAGGSMVPAVQSVSYDADGRTTQRIGGCQLCQTMMQPPAGISSTYDAENHLINEEYLTTSSTGGYSNLEPDTALQWGLDGHPAAMTTYVNPNTVTPPTQPQIPQYPNASLHWDGGSLLYAVSYAAGYPAGAQITLYIGKLGVVDLQRSTGGAVSAFKITTIDRDGSGQAIQEHASDYFIAFDPTTSAWMKPMGKYGFTICPVYTGSGGCEFGAAYLPTEPQFKEPDFTLPPIAMDRADGYQMGDVTIQGVRAYDPSTAQWVSPDAYAGTTTDPGSQKPFMWNGNNPVAYGDPSGFLTVAQENALGTYLGSYGGYGKRGEACTTFLLSSYQAALGLDLRTEVEVDAWLNPFHVWGYNYLKGKTNFDMAGYVPNLQHFFGTTGQLHAFTFGAKMHVGDILFLQGATGDLDHVALVAAVDKVGNPTMIAEGTGNTGTVLRISWATFMAHVRAEHKKITSYGRDNNDDSAGDKGGSPLFYDAETGKPL